ncbi:MAG: hypothetical protein AAGH90_04230 [Pseudomonadota bacterium]
MLHPSTKKLIDRLVAMTAEGKIAWEEGTKDTVVYTTEGYSVTLETDPNEMVITSDDGRELERATAEELSETTDGDGTSYTQRVADMTLEARRKAKGVDKAITTLLAGIDLDGDGVPDIPAADTLEDDIAEANAVIEDAGDDSAIVSADEVTDIEGTQDEAGDVPDLDDVSLDKSVTDTTRPEPDQTTQSDEPVETISDSHDEDVTEAVARLADEVNSREADGIVVAPVSEASHDNELKEAEETSIEDNSNSALEGIAAAAALIAAPVAPDDAKEDTADDESPTELAGVEVSDTELTRDDADLTSSTTSGVSAGQVEEVDMSDDLRATTKEPVSQEITLSGLSAGFGLGALQVEGEASGVPSVSSEDIRPTPIEQVGPGATDQVTAAEPKILIDATDEVPLTDLPSPVEKDILIDESLPEIADIPDIAAQEEVSTSDDKSDEDEAPAGEQVSMTPKTRFNPWT